MLLYSEINSRCEHLTAYFPYSWDFIHLLYACFRMISVTWVRVVAVWWGLDSPVGGGSLTLLSQMVVMPVRLAGRMSLRGVSPTLNVVWGSAPARLRA